tara:strand:+ start:1490 stop:2182 length:693 start_codon:yes stop_codon:yes gene_type:complete
MPQTLDRKSAAYWVVLAVVAVYAGVSITSFARVIEEEQEALFANIDTIRSVNNGTTTIPISLMKTATFKTTEGDIVLELFVDQMPITTGNFIKLAQEDFYDGVQFHRVIENFMIQSGDPNTKGDDANTYGTGGPGYTIEDEFVEGLSNVRGTISMANTGRPNSGGSQFFINLVDNTGLDFDKQPLTSKHPVFGKVIEGMEVVDAIGKTDTNFRDLPETPIVINDIVIEDR